MEYKQELSKLKVAVVHDWLIGLGGAERVVQSLLKLFPQADLYTSVYDPERISIFSDREVQTSFLQHWPLAKKKHQLFAKYRPLAFESFDLSDYDLVFSSCSAESKGVITPTETIHISYIHTPIRYYWSGYHEYLANPGFGPLNPAVKLLMPSLVKKLKRWDYAAAQRPDYLIANSREVARRIKKYYHRDSEVINPPVDVQRFGALNSKRDNYFLVVSRFVPYKRVDLAIEACNRLNYQLVVAGRGPEEKRLKKLAGPTVRFVDNPSDSAVQDLYSKARAFIFSADEDFGITPVEAMAAGLPVICYGHGGATETVINGTTGIYHSKQTVESLLRAIKEFDSTKFNTAEIKKRAKEFSEERFLNEVGGYVVEKIQKQ